MVTIYHPPDPEAEDKPASSSDAPTGEFQPVEPAAPFDATPGPAVYPLPEEPLPDEPAVVEPQEAAFPLPDATYVSQGGGARAYSPPPSQPAYMPPAAPAYAYSGRPAKDRSLALVAEALPGLFGFLGIGWMYAGNTTVGIILLLAFLAWNFLALILDVFSVGLFLCIHLPANLVAVVLSPILLYNYTKKRVDLFGV